MRNYLIFIIFCSSIIISFSSFALIEKGTWNFVKDPDYCYIGSAPEKTDLPEGKKRGDTYILVYRINKNKNPIVQLVAGYPFKKNKEVIVKIDSSTFKFYSQDDTAWTNDDDKVIFAMKKGNKNYFVIIFLYFLLAFFFPKSFANESVNFLSLKNSEVNLRHGPSYEYPIKLKYYKTQSHK